MPDDILIAQRPARARPAPLRDGASYVLPNKIRLVARLLDDGWLLYSLAEWTLRHRAGRAVGAGGRILAAGRPTGWTVADLRPLAAPAPGSTAH